MHLKIVESVLPGTLNLRKSFNNSPEKDRKGKSFQVHFSLLLLAGHLYGFREGRNPQETLVYVDTSVRNGAREHFFTLDFPVPLIHCAFPQGCYFHPKIFEVEEYKFWVSRDSIRAFRSR